MAAKDAAAEEELDLSLDLSLGGSIGTKKSRDKERLKLIKYPSENLQPSLRKFATESLLNESRGLSTSNHNSGNDLVSAAGAGAGRGGVGGGEWVSQKEEVQLQISAAAWPLKPHHHHHRNPHSNYQEQAAEHCRILRTCSSGAVLAPSAALLHRQPSHDFLLAERKKEAPVQQHQHQQQQQQPLLQASELLEWHRKREAQALRRQEARRKREEKQNKKAKNKDLLDSQRSLHREKDRAAREIDLRTSLRKKDCKDSDMAAATMDDAASAAVVADPCNGGSCCKKSGSPDCDDKTSECVASNDHGDGGSPNSFLLSGAAPSASMAALGFSVPYMMQQQQQTRNAAMVSGNALRNGFSSLPGWMQMASMPSPGQAAPISRTSSGRTAPALPDQESRSSEGTSSNESKGQSSKSPEQSSSRNLHHLSKVPSFTSLPSQMLAFSEARTNNTSSRREQPDCSRAADKISCSTAPSSTPQTAWERKNEATCRTSSDIAGNSTEGQHSPCSNAFPKHSSFGDHPKPAANDSASSITCRDSGFKETGNSSATMPLHLVTTTGVGPNGITVTGILTSYSSSQVKIICVCHGTSMTPAEFVQHAGSTDISNPLRNIVVNPIGIPTTLARG